MFGEKRCSSLYGSGFCLLEGLLGMSGLVSWERSGQG